MADQIRPTPRSPILGLFSDLVNLPLEYMSAPQRTQQMQGVAEFIRSTGVPSTLERLSYGQGLFTGAGGLGGTTRLRPEVAEAALTVAPMVGPAARVAGRGAMAVGRAGERYAERVVPQIMERGGLPAEMVAAMGQGTQSPLTVYHGSPYRFNRFDPTKIGTGEGAQAFGYGHYVAESPGVAESYRKALSDNVFTVGGKNISGPTSKYGQPAQNPARAELSVPEKMATYALDSAIKAGSSDPAADAIKHLTKYGKGNPDTASALEVVRQWSQQGGKVEAGSLYKIDLPDEQIARMLDWDKPLSEQGRIMDVLKPRVEKNPEAWGQEQWLLNIDLPGRPGKSIDALRTKREAKEYLEMITGERLYRSLDPTMGPRNSAEALRAAGIPGIRYLDRGSRGAGQGTSNFVVFPGNEDLLRILEVNGEELLNPIMYRDPFGSTVR